MANSTTDTPWLILNPLTPMAFLPPEFGFDLTLLHYVFVGTLGAVIWDAIMCIGADYRLLRGYKITLPTAVYFFSKAATLLYFVLGSIVHTAPIGNCGPVFTATIWIFAIAVSSTTLLFFFRVRAVYLDNKFVVGIFSVMWLGVLGGCITVTQFAEAVRIEPTNYCLTIGKGSAVSAAAIAPMINDLLGFSAVTWRLTKNAHVNPTLRTNLKVMIFGHYLPAFSKALLQDGQIYFLSTVGIYILTVMVIFIKGIPPIYSGIFGIPNVAIMNAMACRMYRNTKLGLYRLPALSTRTSAATSSRPIAFQVAYTRNESQFDSDDSGIKLTLQKVREEENMFDRLSGKSEAMV